MDPTPADIDELLAFLPRLEAPGRAFTTRWAGGEALDARTTTTPYPVYADDVLAFFRAAGRPCWSDYAYDPESARKMLADDHVVARATLGEIRTMLTLCVRGERFCDGFWEALLTEGRVAALLRRLAELRSELGPGPGGG
jgi:hypothetical protein